MRTTDAHACAPTCSPPPTASSSCPRWTAPPPGTRSTATGSPTTRPPVRRGRAADPDGDGPIKYRARNTVDRPGLNAQSTFTGTAAGDRVTAGNDNDTLWGNEGADRLDGGAGNDVTLGGDGDDVITDESGDDFLKGGPGDDAVDGGPGLDIITAGGGKDFTGGGATPTTFSVDGDDFAWRRRRRHRLRRLRGHWQEGGAVADAAGRQRQRSSTDAPTARHDLLRPAGDDEDDWRSAHSRSGPAAPGAGCRRYDCRSPTAAPTDGRRPARAVAEGP